MKRLALWILLTVLALPAWAMPPHPDLMQRIHDGQTAKPYYLAHETELRAQGVENPVHVEGIRDLLLSRGLDENFKAIAILVDFSDKVAITAASFFDNRLYGTGTGTVTSYYTEVTYGNLTIITLNNPSSLGWKRAPQTYAYYVNGNNGFGSYPRNAQKLAEDAIALANPYVNFANYDNDGDGYIEALFIIHAGPGAEYTGNNNDIWSHQWNTSTPRLVDGVYAYTYSMEPEYWSSSGDMTCGVYCHEMGHATFGLPDLYDYGYDSEGLGSWSLMAGGSWNGASGNSPAHPDAWSRIEMGVVTPTVLTSNLIGANVPGIETTPTIYRLWTNGTTGSQFFLVENRRQTGYDAALPSTGLLIYHVDETQSGNNNQWYPGHTSSGHYLVALEQADGLWQLEQNSSSGNAGDPFPGSTGKRTFDSTTTPDSKSYTFANTMVAVKNISNPSATMTADLYVRNAPTLTLTAPNGGEVKIAGNMDTIRWTATELTENVRIQINRTYPSTDWVDIAASTPNDGSHPWTVTTPTTTTARVRITGVTQTSVGDTSAANFTITARTITVAAPNGGEVWTIGVSQQVWWTSQNVPGNVQIELNRTYPSGAWEPIATVPNTGLHEWSPTSPATQSARFRVTSVSYPTATDVSDNSFTIETPNQLPVLQHDPLHDQLPQPFVVTAGVTDDAPGFTVRFVYHSYPGGAWDSLAMAATGNPDEYSVTAAALIPGRWEYLIRVVDVQFAETSTLPFVFAVAEPCDFVVYYDDGTAEASHWSEVTYYRWAVRFDPAQQPFLLCDALIGVSGVYPDGAHSPIHVQVLLADGPGGTPGTLVSERTVGSVGNVVGGVPADPESWVYAVLRDSLGDPLEMNGSFFIAVSNPEGVAFEAFLHDTSSVRAGHSFVYDPCDEAWYNELDAQPSCRPGNRMIRVGGYAPEPPAHLTAAPLGNDIVLRWTGNGAPLYRIYWSATTDSPTYTFLGETSDTTFTDVNGALAGVKFYEVRAVIP